MRSEGLLLLACLGPFLASAGGPLRATLGPKSKPPRGFEDLSKSKNCGTLAHRGEIIGGGPAQPHSFPWVVRIMGGCAAGLCAGTLVTARHVLTAFHCTYHPYYGKRPCDHSDGRRVAVLGLHKLSDWKSSKYIKIIDVKYPANQLLQTQEPETHDFALLVLERRAHFSKTVRPICFPKQDAEHYGLQAVAAGWGRYATPDVSSSQSPVLKQVNLTVSRLRYKHTAMFGTLLRKKQGIYQDPCSGDSGGPLMYKDSTSDRWILIGTLQGGGYDCRDGKISTFEGTDNGLWNKVSSHSSWIKKTIRIPTGEPCAHNNEFIIGGNNIIGGAALQTEGVTDCALRCSAAAVCQAWTLRKDTNLCWLKKSNHGTAPGDVWVWGPRCNHGTAKTPDA